VSVESVHLFHFQKEVGEEIAGFFSVVKESCYPPALYFGGAIFCDLLTLSLYFLQFLHPVGQSLTGKASSTQKAWYISQVVLSSPLQAQRTLGNIFSTRA